ncbi:histidine kinase [Pseudoalteromonas sp. G4]|uniref:histidine kinase n=1 Tax=Pseudoalteromonas sp. G4 TaxID=2992761 RepID=UPI00237E734F|nr:histidine kinase [Pseudoalteromonas sp. G4]MDE3274249.1 histidine kinase [Pseudoalteromonas sp. G4]
MNFSYIRNTSPNYWRYQGPLLVISFLVTCLGIWSMFHEPEAETMPITQLGLVGALILTTYQIIIIFAAFHIVLRGIYKHYKSYATTKWKLFLLILASSTVTALVIIALDFLPILVSLTPYSLEEYVKSIMHLDTLGESLVAYIIYNVVTTVVWAYFYVLAASISNYKQLALLLKKQKLQILTNRVNPEFLFDTMEAIKQQIDIDEEKAAELVTKASDLFRYNLMSSKAADAKLNDEVTSLMNYLELLEEQNRAPKKHTIKLHDDATGPNIPSMTLIFICSFLLNSSRQRTGELSLVGFIKHNKYRIEISHHSHGKFFLDTEHYDNVKSRLEHMYATSASIVLVKKGKQRKVVIELPIDWQHQLDKTA